MASSFVIDGYFSDGPPKNERFLGDAEVLAHPGYFYTTPRKGAPIFFIITFVLFSKPFKNCYPPPLSPGFELPTVINLVRKGLLAFTSSCLYSFTSLLFYRNMESCRLKGQ